MYGRGDYGLASPSHKYEINVDLPLEDLGIFLCIRSQSLKILSLYKLNITTNIGLKKEMPVDSSLVNSMFLASLPNFLFRY